MLLLPAKNWCGKRSIAKNKQSRLIVSVDFWEEILHMLSQFLPDKRSIRFQ
jgi:hypothetical protein